MQYDKRNITYFDVSLKEKKIFKNFELIHSIERIMIDLFKMCIILTKLVNVSY